MDGSGPAGPSQVLFDGRLLDTGAVDGAQQHRRVLPKEEHTLPSSTSRSICKPRGPNHRPSDQRPPLTPPRVAGVSLAPVPDPEHQLPPAASPEAPAKAPAPASDRVKPSGRPSLSHLAQNNAAKAAAAAAAAGEGPSSCKATQLVAEGKGIQRATVPVDPRIAYYHEINGDSDSTCSTPPILALSIMNRPDGSGPFGPLTPAPLSPSILTLCGGMEGMGPFQPFRPVDDEGEDPGPLWDQYDDIPDMRLAECVSPTLPATL